MMYKFMTLEDSTEIVHSDAYYDNNMETVKVYFEKPVYGGFHSAECYLPSYDWKNIDGFSAEDIKYLHSFLLSVAHIIIRLAREGGFDSAANFPSENPAKIWLTKAGRCLLCHNNSQIPKRKLRDIMDIIEARHTDIETKWFNYFNEICYYC